jgi:hypothetical protein
LVHRRGIAGDERVPPVEVVPVRQPAIGTGWRQPDDPIDVSGRKPDAILHLGCPIGIVVAAAGLTIEKAATDIGKIGTRGIIGIFQLDQAAAPAAVAEALPFGIRHLPQ